MSDRQSCSKHPSETTFGDFCGECHDEYVSRNDEAICAHERAIGFTHPPGHEVLPMQRRAFDAGYRAGAEAMREAAALAVLNEKVDADDTGHEADRAYNVACMHCEQAIRALPLPGDGTNGYENET